MSINEPAGTLYSFIVLIAFDPFHPQHLASAVEDQNAITRRDWRLIEIGKSDWWV
ncbi:hypothetical protein [Methylobacterium sp. J-092]|jgi:hypothetical protein|uniref:hypothetical protein n=1 Tax=Methylobacterium sp. J-092 TaxID=2836667 RepID=UPI001FBADAC6|nr:hypothetical protein [Methylobacterium sp. J-092]MCJ2005597.1 hypothetical protein [Methylobacterium sp. J-092]